MSRLANMICSNFPENVHLNSFQTLAMYTDINAAIQPNVFLIHLAIFHKKHQFLKILIDQKANLEVLGAQNMTPLQTAIAFGEFEAVELLVNAGANVHVLWSIEHAKTAWSLLDMLALNEKRSGVERQEILKFLINKGVTFNCAALKNPSLPEYAIEELLNKNVLPSFGFSDFMVDKEDPDLSSAKVSMAIPAGELSKESFKATKDKKISTAPVLFSHTNNLANSNRPKNEAYKPGVPKFKKGFLEKGL